MSRILCIDDEPAILRLLQVVLERGGHSAVQASDARSAVREIDKGSIDAVLLDLGLPDRDGLELIGMIRAKAAIPILVVSARGETHEKVAALDLGAADFVTKPFDGEELLARLRAALRSSGTPIGDEVLEHGPLRIDPARHEASVAGRSLALTPREFAVMTQLVRAGGRVLTHAALLESVWGKAHCDDVEYLRVVMRSLRLKIEDDPSNPKLVRNEPGIGYRLA